MRKSVTFLVRTMVLTVVLLACMAPIVMGQKKIANSFYVRPLIGTHGEGNTYPGAVAPFGMIQISPDTEDDLWETASGLCHNWVNPGLYKALNQIRIQAIALGSHILMKWLARDTILCGSGIKRSVLNVLPVTELACYVSPSQNQIVHRSWSI